MFRGTSPVGGPYLGMVPGPQIPAYTGFYPDASAGPSSSSFRPGFVSSTFILDNEGFTLDELDSLTPDDPVAHGDLDVLGYSQLGGAPLGISQQQTLQPLLRPERQVRSPDRHTYSEGHVCAQQRAKRVRRPRGG
ncbi:uncharacterized protein LOC120703417 [Panicum virgatum]|uniref:uncharacterized protein LOC120703417 n=1 Tax=Panicum virgatum TaxID=38727 RepID=UPI0019D51929|nr:uncharacterized protein LOC120703417 [Panicum virgatum]